MDDLNRDSDLGAGAPDAGARRDAERAAQSADAARVRRADDLRRDDVNAGDEIGEAVGGISGVLTGAALGSLGGPIGTIIGGIAGAVSGWWAGRAISEAASHVTHEEEDYYRTHYERSGSGLADRSYEDVRPAYQIGHLAARNPDYADRRFEDVEGDLRRGWSGDVSARHGSWDQVRDYARHAFDRGRQGFGTGAVAGSATTSAREFDRVSDSPAGGTGYGASAGGPTPTSATGSSSLGGPRNDTSAALGGANDPSVSLGGASNDTYAARGASAAGGATSLGSGADRDEYGTNPSSPRLDDSIRRAGGSVPNDTRTGGGLTERVGNALDDVKDRVDGDPASRPGPDATDRRFGASDVGATGVGTHGLGDRVENAWDRTKNAADDLKDRVDGNPASRPGPDATDDRTRLGASGTFDRGENVADRAGDHVENAWDRTKNAAENLGHRAANAVDDVKDRVDGNPASRPGPDATDRRF